MVIAVFITGVMLAITISNTIAVVARQKYKKAADLSLAAGRVNQDYTWLTYQGLPPIFQSQSL